jgi:hypothetical protein
MSGSAHSLSPSVASVSQDTAKLEIWEITDLAKALRAPHEE